MTMTDERFAEIVADLYLTSGGAVPLNVLTLNVLALTGDWAGEQSHAEIGRLVRLVDTYVAADSGSD